MAFVDNTDPFGSLPFPGTASSLPSPAVAPFQFSPLQSLLPALQPQQLPFSSRAPSALTSFVNKYQILTPILQQSNLPPGIAQALISFDANRAARGQSPLSSDETAKVLQSAIQNRAVTEPKQTSWFNLPVNIFHDASNIISSIPHLPIAAFHEIQAIPELPQDISKALGQGNPLADISALTQVPVIRDIPGAYTVGNLARGDFGEIARHPLMTALDVLPAFRATPLGAKLAESPVGDIARGVSDEFKATKAGQFVQQMWGDQSRQLSILAQQAKFRVAQSLNPATASTGLLDQLAKDSVAWGRDYQKLVPDPIRQRTIMDMAERGNFDPATLRPNELVALDGYRALTDRYAQYGVDHDFLTQTAWMGGKEVFNNAEVRGLLNARASLVRYQAYAPVLSAIKDGITDPTQLTQLADAIQPYLQSTTSRAAQSRLLKGVAYAYDANHFALPDNFKAAVNAGRLDDAVASLVQHTPTPVDTPINQSAIDRWRYQNSGYTPGRLAAAEKMVPRAESRAIPARFQPLAEDTLRARVESTLQSRGFLVTDNPDFRLISDWLRDGKYRFMVQEGLISSKDLQAFQAEARQSVIDMHAAGLDPLFVHRVSPGASEGINYPNPIKSLQNRAITNPTQIRARTFDMAPYRHDLSIALDHQALEFLSRRNTVEFLKTLLRTEPVADETVAPFARTEKQLYDQYAGVGRASRILHSSLDESSAIASRISKEWVKFNIFSLPQEIKDALGWQNNLGDLHPYLPRAVEANLQRLIYPREFRALTDVPIAAFRTAVLPLSPRWFINTAMGGLVMLLGKTDPSVFKFFSDARDIVNAVHAGDASAIPESFAQVFNAERDVEMEMHHAAGTWLGDRFTAARANPVLSKLASGFGNIVSKSFDLNLWIHDIYRTMAYLYGYDKSLTKGLSAAEAASYGESFARRTLMTWDSLTPFERSTLRVVFPFYGYMRHILGYAYHFPIDHPFRAAVTASFARNELADLGTGIPQTFLNSLFLGNPNTRGNVNAVNVGGMNPFRDVANYMTLGGFLRSVNPIITTVLQQLGIQPGTGGTSLYPNVSYDEQTGKLTASHPNFLANLVYNTIPQTQLLTGLLDRSSELHHLIAGNPAAGGRLALSQAGLPILWRQYNLPQEQFKAELARETAQQQALADAFRTGDWASAQAFPALRPVLGQIQQLQQSPSFAQKYDTSASIAKLQSALIAAVS